jgi:hypothetical protein
MEGESVNVRTVIAGVSLAGLISSPPAVAQTRAPGDAAGAQPQLQARYQVFVMEGVLERAVEHGAQMLSRRMQTVMPDMLLLAGAARARGFRLDGYGVFFDVEVPALRRSMAWSFRMLDQSGLGLTSAIESLRQHVRSVADQQARQDLEQALSRLELEVGPVASPPNRGATTSTPSPVVASSTASVPQEPRVSPSDERRRLLADPGQAYTAEVKSALVDAMLDHSGSIRIGADEWLTIAARDNEDRRFNPSDPYESRTIMLRIQGSSLEAFRTGQVSREEARQAVEVREF